MMMGLGAPFTFPQAGRSLLCQSVKSHGLMTADAPLHLSPKEPQSLWKPAFNVCLQQSTLKLGLLPLPGLPLLVRARLCPSDEEYSQPSPASFALRVFLPPWTPESWTINDPFLLASLSHCWSFLMCSSRCSARLLTISSRGRHSLHSPTNHFHKRPLALPCPEPSALPPLISRLCYDSACSLFRAHVT